MNRNLKENRYKRILSQIRELIKKTSDPYARMSTIAALLHNKFNYYFWTGFYRLLDGELTVCSYQGSVACLVLEKHKGVCWAAINEQKTMIVADVCKFPGHIACDSRSASEIVIPVWKDNKIVAVLDVDSKELDTFDEIDSKYLEKIVKVIFI